MRLADLILRQGHLSDAALIEAVTAGERPSHVDRCDVCGDRAIELARWLAEVKTLGADAADRAFPAERLAAQHGQIMRRLAQADEPARVIEFPRAARAAREAGSRRVAPAWVGVAAAAGVVVGVIGSQFSARHDQTASQPVPVAHAPAAIAAPSAPAPSAALTASAADSATIDADVDVTPEALRGFDEATPRLMNSRYTFAR